MHRVGHGAPAVDLCRRVDPRGVLITLALSGDLRGFADQQTGAGTLAVIGCGEFAGNETLAGAIACQRRENDAVRQREIAQCVRGEQGLLGHLMFLPCPLMKIDGASN